MIKSGELVCDASYFNPPASFKQCYTPYENENQGQTIVTLNIVILTKVNIQAINDVPLPTKASKLLRVDAIRLCAVYIFDDLHDEIMEKYFQGNN